MAAPNPRDTPSNPEQSKRPERAEDQRLALRRISQRLKDLKADLDRINRPFRERDRQRKAR